MQIVDLGGHQFRANPQYELVLYERLEDQEKAALRELAGDSQFYGMLRPREASHYSPKRVGPDTALIFLTLTEPGLIPGYIRGKLGEDCDRAVAELVLDGILEVETEDGFASGSRAHGILTQPEPRTPPVNQGKSAESSPDTPRTLPDLSLAALKHAESLLRLDTECEPAAIAQWLYRYNQLPLSPSWRNRLRGIDDVREFLGLGEQGSSLESSLSAGWQTQDPPRDGDPWLSWYSRTFRTFGNGSPYVWKLYISPWPNQIPVAFRRSVKALEQCDALSFKIGANATGLLRPDKMVVYFKLQTEMIAAGQKILDALSGIRAQGVPFTAEINPGNPLVSWGVDRIEEKKRLSWEPPESWRIRVTNQLAVALSTAVKQGTAKTESCQFALARVGIEGIDTRTWTPPIGGA